MKNTLKARIESILGYALPAKLEQPKDKNLAHYAMPVFVLAKELKKAPPQISEQIATQINEALGANSDFSAEAVGGYVNFKLGAGFLNDFASKALKNPSEFAKSSQEKPEKFYIEYISANPTGPLHIGHVRGAVYGDALARVASHLGHSVHTEYYINDAGNQIDLLGTSVALRANELAGKSVTYPEKYYRGEYIDELIPQIKARYGEQIFSDETQLALITKDEVLEIIKKDLADNNIFIENWASEKERYGELEATIAQLETSEQMYKKDGKTYIASTKLGDDEDRVVVREDGRPTYLAGDIIYHRYKFKQGFDHYINIWGADHHGYIARLKAAIHFLGYDENKLEVILMQMVNLLKEGKPFKISKRNGTAILMSDIAAQIGSDALRYIFISKSANTPLEFDIDGLKKADSSNPIFYINYAHARIHQVRARSSLSDESIANADFSVLGAEGLNLAFNALNLNNALDAALVKREMHKICEYLRTLAGDFHKFYNENKVLGSEHESTLLKLFELCALSIRTALGLLGIKAADVMDN